MALDYITIGISLIIFVFYLMIIFMSVEIRKRLNKEAGVAFIYIIIAILVLVIRRVQQIFLEAEILRGVPYFTDFVTLIFAILFFLAIFHFHKSIKAVGKKDSKKKNKRIGVQKNTLQKKQPTLQKTSKPEKSSGGYLDLTK